MWYEKGNTEVLVAAPQGGRIQVWWCIIPPTHVEEKAHGISEKKSKKEIAEESAQYKAMEGT
jgi:hypothetical protein